MKKDRQCGMPPYPVYQGGPMMAQPMPGMMPGMAPGMMQQPNMNYGAPGFQQPQPQGQQGGMTNQEINNINRRLDNLDRRVATLEGAMGQQPTPYNSNFNDSNYQMI